MKTSAAFCRVSGVRQGLRSPCLVLLISALISPVVYGQQWRASERPPAPSQSLAPSTDSPELLDSRAELRRERKMQWLKSANGSVSGPASGAMVGNELQDSAAPRARMGGMSREERHRLRSDIREAGFSAYSPEGNRGRP